MAKRGSQLITLAGPILIAAHIIYTRLSGPEGLPYISKIKWITEAVRHHCSADVPDNLANRSALTVG